MKKEFLRKEDIINKKCSSEQGITLVALVVTIVVLLILAGVSISLVLGQNGLINNAKEAKNKTLEAEKTEGESLNNASDYIKQTVGVTASGITADDYGKVVTNYQDGSNIWEIFYADENNVYLITRNNVGDQTLNDKIDGYNGTDDFNGSEEFKNKYPAVQAGWLDKTYTPSKNGKGTINYSSSYENMKCTEYLLDSSIWNTEYKTDKAEWAIGAPTFELFVCAYNKENESNAVEIVLEEYGYKNPLSKQDCIGKSDEITDEMTQSTNILNHGYRYWIACPGNNYENCVRNVDDDKNLVASNYDTNNFGIRPVVCLNQVLY